MAWESSQGWPKALGNCTRMGDLEEVSLSWLQIGTAPAVVVTRGVSHWRIFLSVPPPLCIYDFSIKLKKSLKKNLYIDMKMEVAK